MARTCPVCRHIERARIDRALASGQSPASIARAFRGLKRHQLAMHRRWCLLNSPRMVHALRAGAMSYERLDELLREAGKSEEEAEQVTAAFKRHVEAG